MPESEPKPKLIELVGPGAGQGWKAVLKSGKPAVVHEIPVPPAEATASVPRMQRLFEHRHPALSPVLAWGIDNNGLWVAVEPNEGTPLGSILTRGPLTPPAAAALGAAVLSGVAALHEAGIAMGGFGATAVRVTSNGDVRIAGHPAAAVRGAPSQSDLRADVRSSGMAVCAAFGVDPAGAPAPANIPPGLVVTMRSMASGAMGPSADRAQGALREMAAALLSPDREMSAQSELETRRRRAPPRPTTRRTARCRPIRRYRRSRFRRLRLPRRPRPPPRRRRRPPSPGPAHHLSPPGRRSRHAPPRPSIRPPRPMLRPLSLRRPRPRLSHPDRRRASSPFRRLHPLPLPHSPPRRPFRRPPSRLPPLLPRSRPGHPSRRRPGSRVRPSPPSLSVEAWPSSKRHPGCQPRRRPAGPDQRAGAQAFRGPPAVAGRPFVRTPA